MTPEKLEIVIEALAHYFDCEVSEITVAAIICERKVGGTSNISYVCHGAPHWHMIGLVDELRAYLEHERSSSIMNTEIARTT